MAKHGPFGARVYLMDNKKLLVYQTFKRGIDQNAPYVVHPKTQRGTFINIADDEAIANAIRAAVNGKLH